MTATHAADLRKPDVQQLLGRAAIYEMLACAFSYPDRATLDQLQAYIHDTRDHPVVATLDLGAELSELDRELSAAALDDLATAHTGLFAGDVKCSPHETEYDFDTFVKARQLADISGFYRAFGLRPGGARREAPDFVATELEFLSFIVLKQVYASVQGWDEQTEIATDAQQSFLQDHAGRWIPVLCGSIAEATGGTGFYAAAAAMASRFVAAEVKRAGAHPVLVPPRRLGRSDRETFTCGLAPEESQVESEDD
jgi:putative dimethyl sulfoxide reductase chaperone